MTIKQQGGIFGRNPTFNSVNANSLSVDGDTLHVDATNDRVGINTSSPVVPLESNTSGNGLPATSGTAQANGAFRISSTATSGIIDIGPNGGAPWIQATDRTDLSQGYTLSLNPNGGNVSIGNGNLVIGTSGNGIDFSATSGTGTSELFDDYEEGTWTAGISTGSGSVTLKSTNQTGRYTKIGRTVHVCGYLEVDTVSTPGSFGTITGLPYTISNNNASYIGGGLWVNGFASFTGSPAYIGYTNTTNLSMRRINAGNATDDMGAYLQANSSIIFDITYTTEA